MSRQIRVKDTSEVSCKIEDQPATSGVKRPHPTETDANEQPVEPVEKRQRLIEDSSSLSIYFYKGADLRHYLVEMLKNEDNRMAVNRGRSDGSMMETYSIGKLLGEGGNGVVYEGKRRSDGLAVVIKSINPKSAPYFENNQGRLELLEGAVLAKLQGTLGALGKVPRLVAVHRNNEGHYLVMERLRNFCSLKEFIRASEGGLSEPLAQRFFIQLLWIFSHLMMIDSIQHNDVKTGNVLVDLDTFRLQVIDFGAADLYNESYRYKVFRGTRSYSPPECFNVHGFNGGLVTVFSLGVILYKMLTGGAMPYRDTSSVHFKRRSLPDGISADCAKVLDYCLRLGENNRIDLTDLMKMAWVNKDWVNATLDKKIALTDAERIKANLETAD